MIRKISAHYVFPVSSSPIKNGIIVIDENGKILDIENPKNNFVESSGLEFYNGILVPGFVNTHCHIELSHLKGKIKEKTGLPDFVSQISNIRVTDEEIIKKAIKFADKVMELSGIVAVGDISNTNFSFETKQKSKIKYHTFLEVFSMDENKAEFVFEKALKLKFELENLNLSSSIVPHAPYSVSDKLFELIKNESVDSGKTITIHNQETVFENQLFINKTGELYDKLNSIGVNYDNFKISGKNSLETISSKLSTKSKTLLVHNTFSTENDIEKANAYFENLFFALCPNANLYIEDKLPDISMLCKEKQSLTIGTDSLASNHKLSVLDEMKTISQNFPEINFSEILKWATLNGAKALGFDNEIGSLEIGKSPGINLISNFDYKNLKLLKESKIKVIC